MSLMTPILRIRKVLRSIGANDEQPMNSPMQWVAIPRDWSSISA